MPTKRAVLYLRVSTDEQTTDNQRLALLDEAMRRDWAIVETYQDQGISGAKGREKRPALDKLLKDATRGRFDVVMCWAIDRLGRSLVHLLNTAQELESAHVDLYLQQQAIDTTSPSGRLYFHIMGAMAEFERGMTIERIRAGQDRARKQGKKWGRPRVPYKVAEQARIRLNAGMGVCKTAKELGLGTNTVQRIKKAMQPGVVQ